MRVDWTGPMDAESEIRLRIAASGPVTFAEFMDVALYHPEGGYYTSGERIGGSGDFYTSPAAHPAFGALLAVQLFQMWELLDRPTPFTVAEPGSGNGLLCRDVVDAAASIDIRFARSLRYLCVDRRPSGGLDLGLSGVSRVASNAIPLRGLVGCVLHNELLDAMPVHQVTIEGGRLREIYVTLDGSKLATRTGEPSTPFLTQRLADLHVELAEGQIAEVNLGLDGWTREVTRAMDRGFILTIDYGRTAQDLYSAAERFRGTLTTFRSHIQTDRPFERVGYQDISAQVDFTTLARLGGGAGLDLLGYITQAEFLNNLGIGFLIQRPSTDSWRELQGSRSGMRELVKRGGLGDFRVMAQGKNVGRPELWGFNNWSDASTAIIGAMPTPMPTPDHIDLLSRRYPAAESEFEVNWGTLWPADPAP